jgi:hypothetical protein
MTALVWIAGVVAMTALGLPMLRIPAVNDLPVPARLAVLFALGQLNGSILMTAMSMAGLPWSRATVVVAIVAALIGTPWRSWSASANAVAWRDALPLAAVILLTTYGAATARLTCGDLLFFWGPKAQHFYHSTRIDIAFLSFPHYSLMHPDYPPLLETVYVWGSIVARRLSLWGAVLLTPVHLLATALAFAGFATRSLGPRRAWTFAALLAAILAYGFTTSRAAGGADPLLLLFEVIALGTAIFSESRGRWLLCGLALAGAALTKVEGAAFAIALLIAITVTRRSVRETLLAAAPPAIALAAWIAFAKHHGILDSYGRGTKPLIWTQLQTVIAATLRQISYRAFYLPFIAATLPLALGSQWRRTIIPLVTALLSVGYIFYFYLHEPEPAWWIKTSAERVFLTTLTALVFASAAAADLDPAATHSLESRP